MMRSQRHRPLAWCSWMWLCVSSLTAISGQAQERPVIEVTPGKARAFTVAVQRFATPGSDVAVQLVRQLKASIDDALIFNAVLKPLPEEAFLGAEATSELVDGPRFDCGDWTQSGAEGLIEGEITREKRQLRVSFAVWDTARCTRLFHGSHSGPPREILRLGRRVADDAVGAFTGTRGVAATEIAFISTRSGRRQVYVMSCDGGDARPATRNDGIKAFPDWLPGAEAILYTRHLEGGVQELFLTSRGKVRAGQILRGVLPGAPKYRGVFSPDGNDLALVSSVDGAAEIFRVHRDGKQLRRLTHSPAIDVSPSWSPDGQRIAFVSDRFGTPQIFVMDSEGRDPRRISYQSSYSASPDWSPDGRWIAYEVRTEDLQFDIYLVDPLAEMTIPLVVHERNDQSPSWSPDGRKIVFSSDRRGRWDLYVFDLGTGTLKRLTRGARDNTAPAWGPFPP